MVDTVVLSLPENKFRILDHNRFNPSTIGFFTSPYIRMGGRSFIKAVQNPLKKDLKNGNYKPRLTVIKALRSGGFVIELKIEYSIPKMCFNNNFDELSDNDFELSVRTLVKKLYEMGIVASFDDLIHADVSAIHYSKNFLLRDHVTCSMVLNELQQIDLSKRIDIGTEKFRNAGYALHFHTNTRDLVFYDKVKDLQQAKVSEKRAFEKDNSIQLSLFDDYLNVKPVEVLRMELRLGNRQEIKRTFERIGIKTDLTFSALFKSCIAQSVLGYFWAQIKESSYVLDFKSEGVFEVAETIRINYPSMKPKKMMELIASMVLIKEVGSKRIRAFLGYDGSPSSSRKWYTLKKEIKSLKYTKRAGFKAIDNIGKDMNTFRMLSLSELICN